MPKPKPKKIGRQVLPNGEAKGYIVPVWFSLEDHRRLEAAAKASKQTLSQWIRCTLIAALEG